ncbi:restriction endonuclease subunit S [Acidithiobacillus thiooxidans]|uniref:restriction endonuclease subunit S n=1 Tax=Acidithiobacillus thiooxidans TaxID=930 RepID=UPI001EE6794E|nr:restriction endonuclease subunit S [Acidithiobacillus thiooxidans]
MLVNSTGTGTLGRVAQVRDEPHEPTTVDSHVTIVRPKDGLFFPEFFGYALIAIENQIQEGGEGCGGQTELARSKLANDYHVSFPTSIPEQRRIVAILDEAFEGIATAKANAEKNLQNAREVFESYLNAVFSQRGEGWVEKRLGDVCEIARGGSPRPIKAFLTDDEDGINWVKISDASSSSKYIYNTAEKIVQAGVKRSRLVHNGDFLLSNSMSFGRPYIMRTTGCIHDGWLVLSAYEKYLNQDFLYQVLGSQYVFEQFDKLAAGSTVRNLNIDLASSVIIPIPPKSVQDALAIKNTELDQEVQHLESIYQQKLAALDELKQSLLHQAFNGDL